jgi:hypothetical protein
MKQSYADIRENVSLPILWFDEAAVPRFAPFHPRLATNIYASEVALMEIECQSCGHPFLVAVSYERYAGTKIADDIKTREIHYGDPPNVDCCASGPSMNSVPKKVIEYWARHDPCFTKPDPEHEGISTVTNVLAYMTWQRYPDLEVDVLPDWAKD